MTLVIDSKGPDQTARMRLLSAYPEYTILHIAAQLIYLLFSLHQVHVCPFALFLTAFMK